MPAYETIYLRVPPELKQWLREQAQRDETTMQDLIIKSIERLRWAPADEEAAAPAPEASHGHA